MNNTVGSVIASPFAAILIPQSREKDLCSSLRVNSPKNLRESKVEESRTDESKALHSTI
jgi:hypothetical protein